LKSFNHQKTMTTTTQNKILYQVESLSMRDFEMVMKLNYKLRETELSIIKLYENHKEKFDKEIEIRKLNEFSLFIQIEIEFFENKCICNQYPMVKFRDNLGSIYCEFYVKDDDNQVKTQIILLGQLLYNLIFYHNLTLNKIKHIINFKVILSFEYSHTSEIQYLINNELINDSISTKISPIINLLTFWNTKLKFLEAKILKFNKDLYTSAAFQELTIKNDNFKIISPCYMSIVHKDEKSEKRKTSHVLLMKDSLVLNKLSDRERPLSVKTYMNKVESNFYKEVAVCQSLHSILSNNAFHWVDLKRMLKMIVTSRMVYEFLVTDFIINTSNK
jgi:hypothetical protein